MTEKLMDVWIVEQGCYSERGIVGVYATAEDAMADNPVTKLVTEPPNYERGRCERPGGWQQDSDGNWHNGLDWSEAMSVDRWTVNGRITSKVSGDEALIP